MRYTTHQFEKLQRFRKSLKPNTASITKKITKSKKDKVLNSYLKELNSIRNKPYSFFLDTKYWKFVRNNVVKRDNYKCQRCFSTTNLQVHHLTYENHFNEHLHLSDLITLCYLCHKKSHSIDEINHIKAIMKEDF